MNSVVGILAAVQYRNRTGKGQYIDVAMLDGLVPFTAMDGTRFLATGEDCGRESRRLNGGSLYGDQGRRISQRRLPGTQVLGGLLHRHRLSRPH